ncbi:lipopolysaccharide assembly protein LapB [Desulfovibrio sp. JC010]|uniref:tetratricopeptide repeat protein n=1 Tax=Desulfovibrio sp. JC010 TaxID=2593641 RepID=UPI0013D832CD|nr:cyclic nucleotide-binding protein [Desulfovibrio sp. JC010]NDV26102.1 cyclic nucleotide-binding protein [Desulfovibrio sp. JC010]
MHFSFSVRLLFCAIIISLLPVAANASPAMISIGDFLTPSGMPSTEFKSYVEQKIVASGLSYANCTESSLQSRYTLSGLMVKDDKGTSFSALLTDNFHLEPDVFIKGKQVGGSTSEPAASRLADSAIKLISNQSVASIEVNGDSRLTPNAVMALAQILPGEIVTPQKIIAARIILENCGLFEKARIYLTPGPEGRKVKISVTEREAMVPGTMPGPGKEVLDNILGPPEVSLPEFPAISGTEYSALSNSTCAGYLAYRAESILTRLRSSKQDFGIDDVEELVAVAAKIRNSVSSYDTSCRDMCIILLKMCSMLDSKTIRSITEELQQSMALNATDPHTLEKDLQRIEFLTQAYSTAQEAQLVLSSRIFHDRIHSPVVPWILFSLGEQALKAEDITRAAPLLNGAIAISSLPVSPEMLLTTARAQYSNLDREAGGAATSQLKPLLADSDLDGELRSRIQALPRLAELCETATSITEQDSFERQLEKGNALILLDRPDLAEPLFHKLHGIKPEDARPFIGFARLAFQRTGNLLSVRPYLERAEHLRNKDRFFYELALAYKLERITAEALPTIIIDGRNSEEASATRFILPKALEYAAGYEKYNRTQAKLIKAGIEVLGEWLAYPSMTRKEAFDNMFGRTQKLETEIGKDPEILAAELYFSRNSANKDEAERMISRPLSVKAGLEPRLLQLNLLLREMALNPSPELAEKLEQAGRASFSDAINREKAVILKADALAVAGLYSNSTETLERAESLYSLAMDLIDGNKGRLLNNLACVHLALGMTAEADDLYDEALDSSPAIPQAVELGKAISSLSGEERLSALGKIAVKNKLWAADNGTAEAEGGSPEKMETIFLNEEKGISSGYNNYSGLWIRFNYSSNIWLLPALPGMPIQTP